MIRDYTFAKVAEICKKYPSVSFNHETTSIKFTAPHCWIVFLEHMVAICTYQPTVQVTDDLRAIIADLHSAGIIKKYTLVWNGKEYLDMYHNGKPLKIDGHYRYNVKFNRLLAPATVVKTEIKPVAFEDMLGIL